jgi:hypothetical protein
LVIAPHNPFTAIGPIDVVIAAGSIAGTEEGGGVVRMPQYGTMYF